MGAHGGADQIRRTYPERNFRLDAATGEYEYVFHPRKTASKQYSFLWARRPWSIVVP